MQGHTDHSSVTGVAYNTLVVTVVHHTLLQSKVDVLVLDLKRCWLLGHMRVLSARVHLQMSKELSAELHTETRRKAIAWKGTTEREVLHFATKSKPYTCWGMQLWA